MNPNDLKTYEEIVEHLGHIIPCYGKPGGCHADTDIDCGEHGGCLMLQMYRAGYRAGANQ